MVLGTCGRRRCRGGPVAGDALSGEPTPAAYAVAAARPLSSGRGPGRSSRPREPRRSVRASGGEASARAGGEASARAGGEASARGEASAQQHLWQSRGRRRPASMRGRPRTGRRRRRGAAAARPVAVWNHSRHAASAGGGCGIRRLHLVLGAAGTSTCGRPPAAGCRCGGVAAGDVLSGARRSDFTGDCSHSGSARSYSKRAHSHSALSPAPESAARGSPAPESAARTCWRTDAPCPEGQGRAGRGRGRRDSDGSRDARAARAARQNNLSLSAANLKRALQSIVTGTRSAFTAAF